MELGGYTEKRLEESQVIDLLLNKARCHNGDLDFFWELTNVPRTVSSSFDTYYCSKEILRTELELEKNQKPGDVDILIIPASKGKIYFEFSSAFEVKIVRPTNKNFRKNSNSLGSTQTLGLINDGFPLVGLIQVCMNEPVNTSQLQHLPNLNNISEIFTFDPFPLYSIKTLYQRILKTDLPKYVGINVFGLSFDQKGNMITQHLPEFEKFKYGYFNPHCKEELVKKIKKHFLNNRKQYLEKADIV